MNIIEKVKRKVTWTIEKWNTEDFKAGKKPYEIVEFEGNVLLNDGKNRLTTIICGGGGYGWDAIYAQLGVGDSSASEDPAQTSLQGGSQTFVGMNGGYPQYGANSQAIWQSDFGNGVAEHDWQEFTVRSYDSVYLNRKTQAVGSKSSGKTWRLTLTITFS